MSTNKNISRGCEFFYNQSDKLAAKNIPGGHKMEVYDWINRLPQPDGEAPAVVEVRFKNTRKAFFVNSPKLKLKIGDIIAVEGTPGVDIGIVTIISEGMVYRQIKRANAKFNINEARKVIRYANTIDIERWSEAISKEHKTMIGARRISAELGLEMKIGDVEYQGDGMKAIFYYIADGRVDFRELIKVLFDRFRVRVEMKQIGARQEAGRIGGIGACGRELCCSGWINHFSTIGIGAARAQDISFNPQKLAGQCSKLKCCLNYEVDSYLDAKKSMPRVNAPLEALDGSYYLVKSDPLIGMMYFSPSQHGSSIIIPLPADRVRKIQAINSRGEKVSTLEDSAAIKSRAPKFTEPEIHNVELEESLTRFDKNKKSGGRSRQKSRRGPQGAQNSQNPQGAKPQQRKENNQGGEQKRAQGGERKPQNSGERRPQGGAERKPQNNTERKPQSNTEKKPQSNTEKKPQNNTEKKPQSTEGGGQRRNFKRGRGRGGNGPKKENSEG